MAMRIPVLLNVEFRGVKPAREYTIRETGEVKTAPPLLKFEAEQENGDVELIEVPGSSFDRMTPPVDFSKFVKGQRLTMRALAVIQDRGSQWDSYLAVQSCQVAKPAS
jgi:hypothetical protein